MSDKKSKQWGDDITVEEIRATMSDAGKTFRKEYEKIRRGTSPMTNERQLRDELAEAQARIAELEEACRSALWNLEEGADAGAAMEELDAVLPEEK